ncbi:type 2C protein phosphatase [Saccharomycopsis crataegensis]|uniref:Type 2C protein phosphatase n=1 Tax=Saccharomycopsis crataegensis TaxID=43959 RepID=A0AAV5QRJ8_9ASCO|nr:type 2C protein phosphatase [Saccharomycopsis crataegensis]
MFQLTASKSPALRSLLTAQPMGIRTFTSTSHRNYLSSMRRAPYLAAAVSGVILALTYVAVPKTSTVVLADNGSRSFSSSAGPNSQQQLKQQITLLSDTQENAKLRRNEESYSVNRNNGVLRYDISQLPSNNPIEDDRSEQIVEVPIQNPETGKLEMADWAFWGVYDGHSGWYTSAKLRDELIGCVVTELSSVYKVSETEPKARVVPSSEEIDQAIKKGFLKLDNEIIYGNVTNALEHADDKPKAAEFLMPGLSGSCGLLSFYDSTTQILKVAVTGDSRALLGSLNEKNQWTVKSLSIDQTGSNQEEADRIRSEHPGEPNAVTRGRVLGRLEPSRAFGDGKFKWGAELQKKIHKQFFSYPPPGNLKTPPYVTAEPVVTTTKINPSRNDFLVLGTDGLFELLTNEEIAGLVIKWAEKRKIFKDHTSSMLSSFNVFKDDKSLGFPKVIDITENKAALKPPYRENTLSEKKLIIEDENVSTHLVRNALTLGTGDRNYGKMLLNIPSPLSRRYRDDLTVVVVFFGENGQVDETSQLKINLEATRGGEVKAKL